MRTEVVEIGSIQELKERSVALYEKAIEDERDRIRRSPCPWSDEILDSAKAILAALGMELYGNFTKDDVGRTASRLEERVPRKNRKEWVRFAARLIAFYDAQLYPTRPVRKKGKILAIIESPESAKKRKKYRERVLSKPAANAREMAAIMPTGVCFDLDFIEAIEEYLLQWKKTRRTLALPYPMNVRTLVRDTIEELLSRETEAACEEEMVVESLVANEVEFNLATGERIKVGRA